MIKPLITDRITVFSLILALLFNAGLWLVLLVLVKPSSEPIALHYTIYFGIDFIDWRYKIFYLPIVGLFIFGCNAFLAGFFYSRERLVSYFLAVGSVIVQLMLLLAAGLLIIYT